LSTQARQGTLPLEANGNGKVYATEPNSLLEIGGLARDTLDVTSGQASAEHVQKCAEFNAKPSVAVSGFLQEPSSRAPILQSLAVVQ
jgi:hypothetical protein